MKHIIVIFLLLCLAFGSVAQMPSRIVFFRMDAPVDARPSYFFETRAYADELMRGDSVLAKMHPKSVFIYDGADISGSYSLMPKKGREDYIGGLSIAPPPGSVVFVRIRLSNSTPISSLLEVIDFADFEKCYDAAEWLPDKLEKAGYASAAAVATGFRTPPADSIVNLNNLPPPIRTRTLTDTLFLDEYGMACMRAGAFAFGIAVRDDNGGFLVKDYFMSNGRLKMTGHYATLDSISETGEFSYYFTSGRLSARGSYNNNNKTGVWKSYYDTTNNPLWYETDYTNGFGARSIKSYYLSGKLKRQEAHRSFTDTVYYTENGKRKFYKKDSDSIISGSCYSETGAPIPYTRFEVVPKTKYDMQAFLAGNLHYPSFAREHNIEGRAVVRFTVDSAGNVCKPRIIRSVSPDIDAEALRVVSAMPRWQPGLKDDRPVSVFFTQPLTFKLE